MPISLPAQPEAWLLFALLSPLFWALVHILDAYCVERVFTKPWMGVITSSLASLVVFLGVPFALPFARWEFDNWHVVELALLAGTCIQASQAFYFQALDYSEAGIVAAYWNLTPTFLPIASFFILGSVLHVWVYVGIALLIATSTGFCLIDTNFAARWKSFFLMLIASGFQTAALMIEDNVFAHSSFLAGFLLVTTGIIISGFLPLLLPWVRQAFKANLQTLKPALGLILFIEVTNLIALMISQRAIDLGVPSIVAAVETAIPAYTFVLSSLLFLVTKRYGDEHSRKNLVRKLLLVGVMMAGMWMVSA